MEQVQLNSIDMGNGLVATQAWRSDDFIALVSTRTRSGITHRSRLDLQKAMFIDPLPSPPSDRGISDIVDAINASAGSEP